jgi:hypothetical protein
MWFMALLLVVFTAGCDRDHGAADTSSNAGTGPTVIFTVPANGATDVPLNRKISAAFSEPMSAATITAPGTFTLTGPGATSVTALSITYDATTRVALFTPAADLLSSATYIGTISIGATNVAGTAMANNYVWTFTTGIALDSTAPLLIITAPVNTAANVPVNQKITATFNEPMDASTITPASYTVTGPTGTIAGNVSYLGATATFEPISLLTSSTTYTVVIAASDLAGNAWVTGNVPNPWIFTTMSGTVPQANAINLGLATPFAIAATAGVVNTITAPLTHINGDVVLDPNQTCNGVVVDNAGGFGLCNGMVPTITGTVITNLYPDTTTAAAVKADLNAAYLSLTPPAGPPAAGSRGGATNLPAGTTLGAVTGSAFVQGDNLFYPGVYQSLTSILITDDITLDGQGDPNALFIFQSASTLDTADGAASPGTHTRILLTNGAKASNIWWQVGSSATIGTATEFYGNILAAYDITMKTGATACGRSMAGAWVGGAGAFVFDSNLVSVPGHPSAPVGCE